MIRNYGKPFPAGLIYPDALYRIYGAGKMVFLTFDDGPDPESTPVILEILESFNIKATFFCTGCKILKNPGLFAMIAAGGHAVGNHGFSHLNGYNTPLRKYCSDIYRGRDITCSNLFRPPYGKIGLRQYRILERTMKIVFWDIMPYDFDLTLPADRSLAILERMMRSGSIIVLHDKPSSHAPFILRHFLETTLEKRYSFGLLADNLARG